MEYLSRCLGRLKLQPDFNFHPKCERMNITHVMFADDLLLFARVDKESIRLLLQAFHSFSHASGLSANLDKSNLYFCGVDSCSLSEILEMTQIPLGSIPFKYLGVPLAARKLSYSECNPLIEKIVGRIKSWASKKLSYAGRIQLIKSVLQGIQSYWSQICLLPKKVMREVKSLCRSFLWTGSSDKSKRSLVAWDTLCLPKVAGGWNILDIECWNQAAIMKFFWAVALKKDKLWIKWVHAYYIKQQDIWSFFIPTGLSFLELEEDP